MGVFMAHLGGRIQQNENFCVYIRWLDETNPQAAHNQVAVAGVQTFTGRDQCLAASNTYVHRIYGCPCPPSRQWKSIKVRQAVMEGKCALILKHPTIIGLEAYISRFALARTELHWCHTFW